MTNQQLLHDIFSCEDSREQQQALENIRLLGLAQQQQVSRQQQLTTQPMSGLAHDASHQSSLSVALNSLRDISKQLKPSLLNANKSVWQKIIHALSPSKPSFIQWFERYQQLSPQLISTITELNKGRDQLKRDNIVLLDDKLQMETAAKELDNSLQQGRALLQDIKQQLNNSAERCEEKSDFIRNDILKALEQRIVDLHSQSLVTQQSLLTTELLVNNNEELIRGISHSIHSTLAAINTANTIALGVRQQTDALTDLNTINRQSKALLEQLENSVNNKTLDDRAISATMNTHLNDIESTLQKISHLQDNHSDS